MSQVNGVGPKRAFLLAAAGVETVSDLLLRIPRRHVDRSVADLEGELPEGEATVIGIVGSTGTVTGKRPRFVTDLKSGSHRLECVWFAGARYMGRAFHRGDLLAVAGTVERFGGRLQMVHPDYEVLASEDDDDRLHTGRIVPFYPTTADLREGGLDSRGLRRLVRAALDAFLDRVRDPLPPGILTETDLPPLPEAIRCVHFPASLEDAERSRARLAFDECLCMQTAIARARVRRTSQAGFAFSGDRAMLDRRLASLPYALTAAQTKALEEIVADMRRPYPMNRLLQGDVGSGKTLVAALSAFVAVADGCQVAVMAPTEVLAEQHFRTLRSLASPLGLSVHRLVGGMPARDRREAEAGAASGSASIVVGTHALLSEGVRFARLGLAIVDEQHRFGVFQRGALRGKGEAPDLLVMTATPIPRTLTMTLYGDLDVSILDELPPGRQPVRTAWRTADRRAAILRFVRSEIAGGRQAYIVYPLVSESENTDLRAAVEGYEELQSGPLSGLRLGLLHGQMKPDRKEAVMEDFKRGEIDVLVATTVVEVGVDVPNASVMVIEHAERFGMSQLHQLRGRVGRGLHPSTCILVADPAGRLSEDARVRLETIASTSNGFDIAEADLRLRGSGDLFGPRQSGLPGLRIADPVRDHRWMVLARETAGRWVEGSELEAEGNGPLRDWLALEMERYSGDHLKP